MNTRRKYNASRVTILLCDIRSAQNAGAIMRTADAIGVGEVVFAGYTPGPVDRFGRENKTFTKSSLSSEHSVSYRFASDCQQEVRRLKKEGAFIVALEQSQKSIDYKKVSFPKGKVVVLLGNEVSGVPKRFLDISDLVAEIPMRGKKESLNVSVSAGIALFRWFDSPA